MDVYGGDTETVKGKPYTFQLWGPKVRKVYRVNEHNVFERFMVALADEVKTDSLLYFHNLEFDLPILFYPFLPAFLNTSFELTGKGFKVGVLYGGVCSAEIRIGRRLFLLYDTMAFFNGSLATWGQVFSLPTKLPHPRGLGAKRYTGEAWKKFQRYGLRDAEIAQGLGKQIESFHARYDVIPTLSAPKLAATILRHKFIPAGSTIPANPPALVKPAMLSYHGGRSGLYVPPGVYRGVRLYDINSAYPQAMRTLPNFLDCEYERVTSFAPDLEGVYCLSGVCLDHPYQLLRDHAFRVVPPGEFDRLWVTSYEYRLMQRERMIRARVNEGWIVIPGKGDHPLQNFVSTFHGLKQTEKGPLREFYKLMLNSLYGKFIQTVAQDQAWVFEDGTAPAFRVAGGLFNPLLASLITGQVRASLCAAEIRHKALHSSTDSIVTLGRMPVSGELGGWSLKAWGDGVFLRPKLYVIWRGGLVLSFALHGFHGGLGQFLSLLRSGKRVYSHRRMRKIKEAHRQGLTPLTMENFCKRINLTLEGGINIPPLTYRGRKV